MWPVITNFLRRDWLISFVSPSATLFLLRTEPISEITLSQNPSLAAATSSIVRFSEALKLFEMMSKRLFLSVSSLAVEIGPVCSRLTLVLPYEELDLRIFNFSI